MHIWGDAVAHTPVTQFTRFMPLYYPIHAKRDLARLGLVDPEEVRKRRNLRQGIARAVGQLRYPLSPMDCPSGSQQLPNLLVVLIDALRPDVINPELTPNIDTFRESGISFVNHYSGGNSSRMGIFSMFYGLPSTYFQSFYDLQQPPVLMDQIRKTGYELALFSAVGFGSPSLTERTAFAGLPELMDESKESNETNRNRAVTDGWLEWLPQRNDQKPFFSFLYFDPPMGDMPEFGDEMLPMDERFGSGENVKARWYQYRMAMAMVDEEFGKVMNALRQHELLDSTIVIVVSDHGYEFDDNGLGYVGHASNFSPVQLHSTLLMHWPGREALKYRHRSSHHDLPVTLLQDVFRCVNPPTDYSVGRNLFSGESWRWIMAGSYSAHAIVQPEQVIVSHPGGFVEILDQDYRPDSAADFDAALIQESMAVQRRFFR